MTEQRQNFANSNRYTNEDAEIIPRPRFCIHWLGGGIVSRLWGTSVRAGAFVQTMVIDRCWSVSICGTDGKQSVTLG